MKVPDENAKDYRYYHNNRRVNVLIVINIIMNNINCKLFDI